MAHERLSPFAPRDLSKLEDLQHQSEFEEADRIIFVTTIRSGKDTDGLDIDIANAFNRADVRLSNGKRAKVRVRKIASGTGYQFISSRKYLPDAFSPVHQLWIEMAKGNGIPMTSIRDRTVRSVGGVVMKTEMVDVLRKKYGSVDIKSIITGVAQGDLAMGYTNPFASSTGLNFLLTILSTFAEGDESAMLSPSVVSAFEQFQRGVPFVPLTTVHMRDSVRNDGSLDAFILGHQTYSKTDELQSDYEFFPFGIQHDHPLYAVGDLPADKLEVLEQYAEFSERPRYRKLAKQYGWNASVDFQPTVTAPSGETLIRAQLKIPIYTIGYDADIKVLKKLSGVVEAASINANEGQIGYKIGSMLNAQM